MKHLLMLWALCLPALAWAGNFQIQGKLTNLTPAKAILTVRVGDEWKEYRADVRNGVFQLAGPLEEPSFAYLVMKYETALTSPPEMANITELFVIPGPMKVAGGNDLATATIDGGAPQQDLLTLHEQVKVWQTINGTSPAAGAALSAWQQSKLSMLTAFVEAHPDSYVSLHAIRNFSLDHSFLIEPEYAQPLFERLSPTMKNRPAGRLLWTEIETAARTAVGAMAPDFSQADPAGRVLSLHDLRGKYLLLDFWASWCGPCRKENPEWVRIYGEFHSRNFEVLGIALDSKKENWMKAIVKDQLPWPQVSDLQYWRNAVALQYGVRTIPQNFLISPEGKILGRNLKPHELEEMLKSLLP